MLFDCLRGVHTKDLAPRQQLWAKLPVRSRFMCKTHARGFVCLVEGPCSTWPSGWRPLAVPTYTSDANSLVAPSFGAKCSCLSPGNTEELQFFSVCARFIRVLLCNCRTEVFMKLGNYDLLPGIRLLWLDNPYGEGLLWQWSALQMFLSGDAWQSRHFIRQSCLLIELG